MQNKIEIYICAMHNNANKSERIKKKEKKSSITLKLKRVEIDGFIFNYVFNYDGFIMNETIIIIY